MPSHPDRVRKNYETDLDRLVRGIRENLTQESVLWKIMAQSRPPRPFTDRDLKDMYEDGCGRQS